jgi:Mn-dependent DtxR family transcriptional regulator
MPSTPTHEPVEVLRTVSDLAQELDRWPAPGAVAERLGISSHLALRRIRRLVCCGHLAYGPKSRTGVRLTESGWRLLQAAEGESA